MPEIDALVSEYSHLKKFSRRDDALQTLKKIASLVKPIMRARNWRVAVLAEFYPDEQNLLGINQNRGQKICLRLRYPGDKDQFLPLEHVVDTMLHELAHNVIGPHNAAFHALWDQLRKEYDALMSKGYTGEGFLSDGHKLGGAGRIPMTEARRVARAAAERRRTLTAGSGQKLGGRPVLAGTDIRKVIVDAIERRSTVLKGCGSGEARDEKEIKDIVDQATQNGFKTKAEEDAANERAISQAMWELVQEDQKKEYGDDYIASTAENPSGNGAGQISPSKPLKMEPSSSTSQPKPSSSKTIKTESSASASQPKPGPSRQPPKHVSRLVTESTSKKPKPVSKPVTKSIASIPAPAPAPDPEPILTGWTCNACTLHNPLNYLSCDACMTERPPEVTQKIAESERKKTTATHPPSLKAPTWTCRKCTTVMEEKWWSCSTCLTVKASS
ncbi:DNA-dependent metalloprotease [Lachnellula hyalina]|uniref:DNA-dependent metalloprotease n=1 Tax=Lachnellula hyalina TaxID=1316788 RepID=A0A8H8QZX7_9HELO|nr:DNA-dependent metalloprotease [Lachnellula hyalina]TVY25235.1 DNA-dependent metalloprotease [Lachnellula hyalina]